MKKRKLEEKIGQLIVELSESSDSLLEWAMKASFLEGKVVSLEKEVLSLRTRLALIENHKVT